jgi:hypothetical protein
MHVWDFEKLYVLKRGFVQMPPKTRKLGVAVRLIPREFNTSLYFKKRKAGYSACSMLLFRSATLWAFEKVVLVRTPALMVVST